MAKRFDEEIRAHSDEQARLVQVVEEMGTKPFDFDSLKNSHRWPEGENVDEFIAAFREWRREGNQRKIP